MQSQVADSQSILVEEDAEIIGDLILSGRSVAADSKHRAGQFDGDVKVCRGQRTEFFSRSLSLIPDEHPVGDGQNDFGSHHFFFGTSSSVARLNSHIFLVAVTRQGFVMMTRTHLLPLEKKC